MYCYDCGLWRSKFTSAVVIVVDKVQKIVGWRCKKCHTKAMIGRTPSSSSRGNGWRARLKQFLDAVKSQQERLKKQGTTPHASSEFKPIEVKKNTVMNKIAQFFQRRAT